MKLNKKGFTLVELLAVIIILAIVVGITIPAVLTTTNKTKKKAFDTAAASAADWFDRQYAVAKTGIGVGTDASATLDATFSTLCGTDGNKCEGATYIDATTAIAAAGLKASAVSKMEVYINSSTGRSCVQLTAAAGGDYSNGSDTSTTTGGICN